MNTHHAHTTGRGLRGLDLAVKILYFALIVVTVIAIPLLIVAGFGSGTLSVPGTLDDPYRVSLDDGRAVAVGGGTMSFENFEIGEETGTLTTAPAVTASLRISDSDLDSRIVIIAVFLGWLAAAWVGLVNLRRLVRSALAGHPFSPDSPGRLRWLGAAVLFVPAVTVLGNILLSQTTEFDVPFSVSIDLGSWMALVVVGIGLIALAEVFAEAVRLQEFEEATI